MNGDHERFDRGRAGGAPSMETDEAIYSRCLIEEDDADLEALLIRHRDGLLLFLCGFVRSPEDAEKLPMDTFARLT